MSTPCLSTSVNGFQRQLFTVSVLDLEQPVKPKFLVRELLMSVCLFPQVSTLNCAPSFRHIFGRLSQVRFTYRLPFERLLF